VINYLHFLSSENILIPKNIFSVGIDPGVVALFILNLKIGTPLPSGPHSF
jgi:hypothetical protein